MQERRGKHMADLEAMAELVRVGKGEIEAAEDAGETFYQAILALEHVPDDARSLEMIGALKSGEIKNRIREAAGHAAKALAIIYDVHGFSTKTAQAHGVDVPAPRDGGGGR